MALKKRTIATIIHEPRRGSNILFYAAGLGFLALAKLKHRALGYSTPRPFPASDFQKAIAYDCQVVDELDLHLNVYTGKKFKYAGKHVLDLGPGDDLGVGILLLGKGVRSYSAIDVNNLVKNMPAEFYSKLLELPELKQKRMKLKESVDNYLLNNSANMNYVCDPSFGLDCFLKKKINLVISRAAFEHFDDVEKTLKDVSKIVKKGAVMVLLIDLQTHSRWIREQDPLNIYRYGQKVYDVFWFRGIPNRVRSEAYAQILKQNGWKNVKVYPTSKAGPEYVKRTKIHKQFKGNMEDLCIVVCATKA